MKKEIRRHQCRPIDRCALENDVLFYLVYSNKKLNTVLLKAKQLNYRQEVTRSHGEVNKKYDTVNLSAEQVARPGEMLNV